MSACVLWDGPVDADGYGRLHGGTAHRIVYRHTHGDVPAGLDIDHTCHNADPSCAGGVSCVHRRCINPEHLEAVSRRDNTLRGKGFAATNATKTHCPKGHEYTPENTYTYSSPGQTRRCCRECNRLVQQARRERRAS